MPTRLPSTPPVISGFSYVRPLGAGGFADVFLFQQNMPNRPVAIKVLLDDIVDDGLLRMFNAEADVMAALSAHPSILTIYQASVSADGRPYLVTEFCPGTYNNRYRSEQIPLAEVLDVGVRIGSALETAHRAGLLHRDIKPSNLLVTSFGTPVLADFGIATSSRRAGSSDEVFAMSVPWSSPEVIDEKLTGSVASEVWSLGATLYTFLAGHSPFELPGSGKNGRDSLKNRIRKGQMTPLERNDVPPELMAVLKRSMSVDPQNRQSSTGELARELQYVQHQLGFSVTNLEIPGNEWAGAGSAVSFNDDRMRGPAHSVVPHESRRPTRKSQKEQRTPEEGTILAGSAPKRSSKKALIWTLAVAVPAVLIIGAAITIFLLGQSG